MEELEKTVCDLSSLKNRDAIVSKLQEIGAKLLTEYEIRVNNITIEPLRLEPYFYNDGIFEDKFIHSDKKVYGARQRDRFRKLYIHKGFSGVDIVLSNDSAYAFSFLIKNSRISIDGAVEFPFVKQYGTAEVLKKHGIPLDYDETALYKKDVPRNIPVFRTVRNGLNKIVERDDFPKQEQAKYSNLLISSFIELKEHTSAQYDFATGYGGDNAVIEYLKEYKTTHPDVSNAELYQMRRELYPNGTKSAFIKEFGDQ